MNDCSPWKAPHPHALCAIARLAACSPCAKSKRAVVVYERYPYRSWGAGFNTPPAPMRCDGSEACRRDCSKICMHAEQMAIRAALEHRGHEFKSMEGVLLLAGLEMVHVKVVDGQIVPGGPPSCWQCSREVLEMQIGAFWLFEAKQIVEAAHQGMFPPITKYPGEPGKWRCYTAEEFHRTTLKNCGLHVGGEP